VSVARNYFEDVPVGYRTSGHAHEVTAAEIIDFGRQWDPMPFHIDAGLAASSPYGGLIASGGHTYAIFLKLAHRQEHKLAVIAALGVDWMKFNDAVRPGDVLHMEGECVAARASASKPDRGICTFLFRLISQHGKVVLEMQQPLLLARRDSGLEVFSLAGA
jgi:acyl dehydratase